VPARLAVAFVFAGLLPSCTLAGGFVGSQVPSYTPASVGDARDGLVNDGERVSVVRASDGAEVVGTYRGLDAAGLEIDAGDRLVSIDPSDVRSVSVSHGTYWAQGAAIGLALDVAVAIWAGTRLAPYYPDTSGIGNIHIGSDGVTVGAR
jgi:hypothetical protein